MRLDGLDEDEGDEDERDGGFRVQIYQHKT